MVEAQPDQGSAAAERFGTSFVIDPGTGARTALPETGRTWRPSVDPTGRRAVYWTGTLKRPPTRRWTCPTTAARDRRLGPGPAVGERRAADTPAPDDQATARHETTIDAGAVTDWDARWDPTGTRLAVWIADPRNPDVGRSASTTSIRSTAGST